MACIMQAEAEACIVRQVWASDTAIGIRMVWPGAGTEGRFDLAAANPDFDADADFEVQLPHTRIHQGARTYQRTYPSNHVRIYTTTHIRICPTLGGRGHRRPIHALRRWRYRTAAPYSYIPGRAPPPLAS
jgi:hypothetical protein